MLAIGAMCPPGSRILYFGKSSLIDNTTASASSDSVWPYETD